MAPAQNHENDDDELEYGPSHQPYVCQIVNHEIFSVESNETGRAERKFRDGIDQKIKTQAEQDHFVQEITNGDPFTSRGFGNLVFEDTE